MRLESVTTRKEAWFEYPDDKDGAKFKIGLLTPGEQRDVESRATRLVYGEGKSQGVEVDHNLAGHLRAGIALKDWENVCEDAAGSKNLKFTPTNKQRMLNGVPGFEAWVLEKLSGLVEEEATERESERKN